MKWIKILMFSLPFLKCINVIDGVSSASVSKGFILYSQSEHLFSIHFNINKKKIKKNLNRKRIHIDNYLH